MSIKVASSIASVVTLLLALVVVAVFGFGGIVLLNGYADAGAAVNAGFVCMGITLILSPILAWALTKALIVRTKWNNALAVVISVLASTLLSGLMGFASVMVMVIIADIMWRS